jgi:hypothetical protein
MTHQPVMAGRYGVTDSAQNHAGMTGMTGFLDLSRMTDDRFSLFGGSYARAHKGLRYPSAANLSWGRP